MWWLVNSLIAVFSKIILATYKQHILAGFVQKYTPFYSSDLKLLKQQRRRLLSRPTDQGVDERIHDLSDEIQNKLLD